LQKTNTHKSTKPPSTQTHTPRSPIINEKLATTQSTTFVVNEHGKMKNNQPCKINMDRKNGST
jgi:hypothetical protein